MSKKQILLTPGPTPVPPFVLKTLAQPLIHHRTREYTDRFREVLEGLKLIFRTQNPVVTFTSSGTGAMEASVVNFLSPGDTVLVLVNGKFSERFCQIAEHYGLNCRCLRFTYGDSVDALAVAEEFRKTPDIKAVYAALCETSTGVVNDVEAIGRIVSQTGAVFAVDAISGLLAERLETDDWKVDIGISGSQKGLMIPPGLAFLSVSPKAEALLKTARLPRFYFDLRLYSEALKDADSPFTPAIALVLGLQAALENIKRTGVDAILIKAERFARATRAAMTAAGLELFAKVPANALTAVRVPEKLDAKEILRRLSSEFGITIAGGQGELQGQILRIAHLGFIQKDDLIKGLMALETVLSKMGHSVKRGLMTSAFNRALKIVSQQDFKRPLTL